jgi:hypothetical protein
MAGFETRSVILSVDIRRHYPVEIAPPDDEPKRDATFVNTFNIVGGPRDGVGDAGVDSHGSEEGASILYVRVSGACSHSQ